MSVRDPLISDIIVESINSNQLAIAVGITCSAVVSAYAAERKRILTRKSGLCALKPGRMYTYYQKTAKSIKYQVITGLFGLLSYEPTAIEYMQNCRINIDFGSQIRSDIEFYIPQLCSFAFDAKRANEKDYLHSVMEFIVTLCELDFELSHKVWFFLKSIEGNESVDKDAVKEKIKLIEDNSFNSEELLYIPNSGSLLHKINENNLQILYGDFLEGIDQSFHSEKASDLIIKCINEGALIKKCYTMQYSQDYDNETKQELLKGINPNAQIPANAIVIRPFIADHIKSQSIIEAEEERYLSNSSMIINRIEGILFYSKANQLFSEHIMGVA